MKYRLGAKRMFAITFLGVMALLAACGGGDEADGSAIASAGAPLRDETSEDDVGAALVDYGSGPMPEPTAGPQMPFAATTESSWLLNGGPNAKTQGAFGPAFTFPIIPIHIVMLPDGRLLAYGSDDKGRQTALLHYLVYDPEAAGYPFLVLPNTTNTDMFCSTQVLLPQDGKVLLAGGDRVANGERNYAIADVSVFDPVTGRMEKQSRPMNYRRWYATGVVTPQGEYLVLGGRDDRPIKDVAVATFSSTPEIYNPTTGWRTLPGATSNAAYGGRDANWSYPKAWVAPNGQVVVLGNGGSIFQLNLAGTGKTLTLAPSAGSLLPARQEQPSVMFRPGMILAARSGTSAQVVDIHGAQPVVESTSPMNARRLWGSMTLLPDGRVWANGGSMNDVNDLAGAVYSSELWNPADGSWTPAASATKPRLYHSNSILLRDGRVLTGGGGAPGPVRGLNAEIYYPPYLFKPGRTGELAQRPVVTSVSTRSLLWSSPFTMQMSTTDPVSRVIMLRTGSATHNFNGDQRRIALSHTQVGKDLFLTMHGSRNHVPPGYYMVFVFDAKGVPSVAEIIKLG